MAPVVVVRNDEFASLLDDDWSPVPAGGLSSSPSPSPQRLHGKQQATTTRRPRHAVTRFMCSPFAAVFRTCARADDIIDATDQRPSNGAAGVERQRRGARRRPSLEQLLRMEAPPTLPSAAARPAERKGPSCTVAKEKQKPKPVSPSRRHYIIVASDEEQQQTAAVPADAELDDAGRQTNAKRLVVVLASLRACSRAPRINSGKVAASRAPGKTELFYYRPIPMGRRCRVQHLEESPYK